MPGRAWMDSNYRPRSYQDRNQLARYTQTLSAVRVGKLFYFPKGLNSLNASMASSSASIAAT